MYAIFANGSHQYKVEEGQMLVVQLLDLAEGQTTIDFDRVLLVSDGSGAPKIGAPNVVGAKVTATVLSQIKDTKVYTWKFRRRKGYRRKYGHRQSYHKILVDKITA